MVLCTLLAPSQNDQAKLTALIEDMYQTDAVLGDEIAFLLLHPGAQTPLGLDKGYGEFATLRGTAFVGTARKRDLAYSLRETQVFRDMSRDGDSYRKEIAEKSSKAMALFVPEFMELFGVRPSEVPALCILVKGMDESVVVPMAKDWTVETVLEVLGKLRNLADSLPNFNSEYQTLAAPLPLKLPKLEEATREIDAKSKQIEEILERLLGRHGATEGDRNLVAGFVARKLPDTVQLECVLSALSFIHTERYGRDGQALKVRTLMKRLEFVRLSLRADFQAREYVLSVADRAQAIVLRREKLLEDIRSIPSARLVATTQLSAQPLRKIRNGLENINLAGDLGEKFMTGIEWLKKLASAFS